MQPGPKDENKERKNDEKKNNLATIHVMVLFY